MSEETQFFSQVKVGGGDRLSDRETGRESGLICSMPQLVPQLVAIATTATRFIF
ncbi:hypothetical protein [Planktothricoides sp. SR001]|uniref:hypothetical protein n=1 Tax=Planktothricoides sp. SR001 TaxID=1705388 RepID=UPI0012E223BA|nr:hypothetical protein [Planktothricoides sp. SR001]